MLNKKEMVKEIANLIINRVDFSEIDFTKQKVRVIMRFLKVTRLMIWQMLSLKGQFMM